MPAQSPAPRHSGKISPRAAQGKEGSVTSGRRRRHSIGLEQELAQQLEHNKLDLHSVIHAPHGTLHHSPRSGFTSARAHHFNSIAPRFCVVTMLVVFLVVGFGVVVMGGQHDVFQTALRHTAFSLRSWRVLSADIAELFVESDDATGTSDESARFADIIPGVVLPVTFAVPSERLRGVLNASTVDAHPGHRSVILADVFLQGACIRVVSATECDFELDFRNVELAVHGAFADGECSGDPLVCGGSGGGGAKSLWSRPRGPLKRLRVRTLWEWTVLGDVCSSALKDATHVDVEVFFAGSNVTQRSLLTRGPTQKGEDVAMMLLFRRDLFLTPLWLQYWEVMGVKHFYLYYNGFAGGMMASDPEAVRNLLANPRVTIVQWAFPMWQTGQYRNIGDRPCVGHFAQMMAFNDAYHRFAHQHRYMGFFDFDEFLVMQEPRLHSLLSRLPAGGVSPIMSLLWSHGFPLALSFMNRWGALLPPMPASSEGAPLTPELVMAGHEFYGAHNERGRARSKYFVRCYNFSSLLMLGNHDVFELNKVEALGGGLEYISGNGYERETNAKAVRVDVKTAYFLHVVNFRPHQSALPFDEEAVLAGMLANDTRVVEMRLVLDAAIAARTPGVVVAAK